MLDLDLLKTFIKVADTGGFTRAGEALGRTQSAISLQIKRLEEAVGKTLFERTTRTLALTPDGERLLGHARHIMHAHDAAWADLCEPDVQGSVRLGVPEDFASVHLPDVLAAFTGAHPRVELEVTCDLTLNLLDRFQAGDFDLVMIKREVGGPTHGVRVWREPLVWVGQEGADVPAVGETIPLVVSPQPCVYRKRATRALDEAGRRWRVAYTSTSLTGCQAAVRAGLGLTVLPREMVPPGLQPLSQSGLPDLHETEIALIEASDLSKPAHALAEHIIRALG
jgi:DNA-binding transcriptional LysR family regulator